MLGHEKVAIVLVAVLFNRTDGSSWYAGDNRAIGDVVRYNRAGPHDTISADGDARKNKRIHADVTVVTYGHAPKAIAITKLRMHMAKHPATAIVGSDLHSRRDANIFTDSD